MSLSELSIRRPVFAWMLMTGLIIFGGISFFRMGISQLPDVDFPVVSVNIRLEGAAPSVIETEVVDLIEDAVMGIQGVRSVTSNSENSEGTITVEFELNRDIDLAVQDVQAKVAQIQQKLPREISPPTISKINPEDQPIILLTLDTNKYPLKYLMSYVNDRLKDQFSMVAGVGDITLTGYTDPNLRVWVSEKQLNHYSLTVSDVINLVQTEHSESPAGQVESGRRQLFVRTLGEATSVGQFEKLFLNKRGGQPNYAPIPLKQIARIEEGLADPTRISRAMGVPGVGLGIRKQRGSNAVEVAKAVRAKIVEIQKSLPEGMHLAVNFDSTRYIEQAVQELDLTLLLSALLTALVCWMFLGSWSSTFNVLLSIPTSIIGTFIVLYFAGFTLNTFTLLGLSLSIGIVVDDAIMVLENIIRHQERGKDKLEAALVGAKEITFAALAATISIVAIFLPVAFMKGIIGKFFFQFGVTMTVAVLLSLVEALTLTPMRCSQFVEIGGRKTRLGSLMEHLLNKITDFYSRSLIWTLKRSWQVIVVALVFFGISLSSIFFLNKEFLPSEDQSRFNVRLKTPIGSSLTYSDLKFQEVEKFLSQRSEIDRYVLQVGGGSPGDSNSGSVLVTMKDRGHRGVDQAAGHELSQQEFMAVCRKEFNKIPDVRAVIQDLSQKTFVASRGFPVEFTVQGPEWDDLAKYSHQIMEALDKTGLMTDLDTDYQVGMPELHVLPDRQKAADHGVSIASIDETVNAMIGGVLVGRYPKGGHRYDIRLKLEESNEEPLKKVNSLFVRNNRDQLVPLSDIVTVEEKPAMVSISRRERERSVTIYANVKAGESQQKALQSVETISKNILPPEYHISFSGSSQTFSETFQSLILALILGLFVAYMVLASQFNSFVDPLTVLMALPFSVSGAFVALLIAHQSINIYSMIGLILLMGIVKKNSILLVDFTNQVRAQKQNSVHDALLEACPVRLRPILMTSVATIAGAIPAAISFGPGAESRTPMAIAVIGGVLVSTLLTLFVVPAFYSLFSRTEVLK
ncbi:MAG: acriflavin resistance protein [Bacteriovoracaceae bacterium]|nr:acriflavin resistance protein [Bacteriovoracaceae bacterium]